MGTPGYQVNGASWLARVSDEALRDQVGAGSFARGADYADHDMVRSISTGDRGRMVLGTVDGNRARPYTTIITLAEDRGEPRWVSRCSCPMALDCKHVVALMIVARARAARDGAVDTRLKRTADWREAVGRMLEHAGGGAEAPGVPLALRFEVQAVPTSYLDSTPRPQLTLRASRWTRSGRWGTGDVWRQVRATALGYGQHDLDGTQAHALAGVLASMERSRSDPYASQTPLDKVDPSIWDALTAAQRAGVTFIGAAKDSRQVRLLDERVRPRVDFTESDDGSLTGGARIDVGVAGQQVLLGQPVHGVAVLTDEQIVLAGLQRPATPTTSAMLGEGELHIPRQDAAEFRDLYLPRITAMMSDAGTGDGATDRVQLQITVTSPGEQRVEAGLRMLYAGRYTRPVGPDYSDLTRDRAAERAMVDRIQDDLQSAGLMEQIGGLGWWPAPRHEADGWRAVRLLDAVQRLREHPDVVLRTEGELPTFEEAQADPLIEVSTTDADDPDWFDLHVSVTIDGETVPFEPLFTALVRGDEAMLLASGTWFSLGHPALERLRDLIQEARGLTDKESPGTAISRYQLGLWDELVNLGVVGSQSAAWEGVVKALQDLDELVPPPVPDALTATLRPYQQEGYAWLSALWDCGLGGILADDMGLGKTVQALAALVRADQLGELDHPVLVVAPSSVVGTWTQEARRFAPTLRVATLPETSRRRGAAVTASIGDASLVITSYTVLRLDADEFAQVPWRGLLLDEAQAVKNHQSKTFQAAKRIGAPFTLAITGTPLENSLMDLWSMLSLAAPGLFPRPDAFTQTYRRPIEAGAAPQLLDRLRQRIRPLMLRRTKEQVATDLPPKQVQRLDVTMTARHDQAYRRQLQRERQRVLGMLDDFDGNRVAILASLTRLRQLALDPRLLDDAAPAERSAKLSVLVEQLRELAGEGHRALVFSQFTSYLRLAQQALADADISTTYLDGRTRKRQKVIDGFKTGGQTAFLISLKAGGVGLTLTEADYVFVLDPWWNPAAEAQAIDRAHRIGQQRPVTVYRLVSAGTIEEKVVALQERKRKLFQTVVDDGGAMAGAVTAADIRALLE